MEYVDNKYAEIKSVQLFHRECSGDQAALMGVMEISGFTADEDKFYFTNFGVGCVMTEGVMIDEYSKPNDCLARLTSSDWRKSTILDKDDILNCYVQVGFQAIMGREGYYYFYAALPELMFGAGDSWWQYNENNWKAMDALAPSQGESVASLNHKTHWSIQGGEYRIDTRFSEYRNIVSTIYQVSVYLFSKLGEPKDFNWLDHKETIKTTLVELGYNLKLVEEELYLHPLKDAEFMKAYYYVSQRMFLQLEQLTPKEICMKKSKLFADYFSAQAA